MKGIGLVFAGGGGKGSYEIGVWKYLHEMGLDQYVRAVSGTSVGALNAALFVGSSFEVAEELWLNVNSNKILTPKKISDKDVMNWFAANGLSLFTPVTAKISKAVSGAIMGTEKIAQSMLTKINGDHMFSREGITEMIYDGINFNLLQTSDIPCYATCVRCDGLEVERFKLNEYTSEDITTLLLASSAIPVIFPNEEFQGNKYCDGGIPVVGDNVPIKAVYDTGVETIIVVHLGRDVLVDTKQFPNARIIEIVPREDLGNAITGTLDFSPEGAAYRIKLGYEDAKIIMQPMMEMIALTVANQKMLKIAQQRNIEFEQKREKLLKREKQIKEEMANDGFDELFAKLTRED